MLAFFDRWRGDALLVLGALALGGLADAPPAAAICRVVEPARDSGQEGVPFDPTTAALYVWAPNQIVDYRCAADDGGAPNDGGAAEDAGAMAALDDAGSLDAGSTDAGSLADPSDAGVAFDASPPDAEPSDAGVAFDASSPDAASLDAGAPDPSVCPDGSLAEPVRGTLTSLVVQPSILASGGSAGLVMPVPGRPDVHVGSASIFTAAASLMRGRVHETATVREDPSLGFQCTDPHYTASALDVIATAPLALYGCSADGSSDYYRPGTETREPEVTVYGDAGVVQWESFATTDAYDVTVLNASTIDALRAWLDEHGFAHDEDDDQAFSAYVGEEAWFVAVHVHPPDTGDRLALEPLVVTWRGTRLPVTHRLQYDPNGGMLITDAFVIAPTRMGAADGSAFTEYAAPVELRSTELGGFGLSSAWLTRLTMTRLAHEWREDSEIVPEEVGREVRPTVERRVDIRIPAPCCPGGSIAVSSPDAQRTFTHERDYFEGDDPGIPDSWFYPTEELTGAWCNESYESSWGSGSGSSYSCLGGSSSSSSGRTLRGCTVYGPREWGAIAFGWGPLVLVVAFVVLRHRRR